MRVVDPRAMGRAMALLSATCPRCGTVYQVDPALRGKRMRCNNTICRTVFVIGGDGEPAAPKPETPARPATPGTVTTGSVMDLVPVLPAEAATPEPEPAPVKAKEPAAPSWQAAPPVRAT